MTEWLGMEILQNETKRRGESAVVHKDESNGRNRRKQSIVWLLRSSSSKLLSDRPTHNFSFFLRLQPVFCRIKSSARIALKATIRIGWVVMGFTPPSLLLLSSSFVCQSVSPLFFSWPIDDDDDDCLFLRTFFSNFNKQT
jgi:hypothetical protein